MSNPPVIVVSLSTNEQTEISAAERRLRWFEVSLVLLIAFGGSILMSLHLLANGPSAEPPDSSMRWSAGILQEASALLLLGYVLSRRGLRFSDLGLRWSVRGVGVGLLLAFLSYVAYAFGYIFVHAFHRFVYGSAVTGPSAKDFFGHPSAMVIPFSLLNPFFEELIVRAYLMTEITQLTRSSALAVFLSVVIQFCYHLYYGWAQATSLSFLFLAFALYYARSRNALPIIIAHGFFDLYALFRLW